MRASLARHFPLVLLAASACAPPQAAPSAPPPPLASQAAQAERSKPAVAPSDPYALRVLGIMADFLPETIGQLGIIERDESILDLGPRVAERYRATMKDVLGWVESQKVSDPHVQEDLEILAQKIRLDIRTNEVEERTLLPYECIAREVFDGVHALLDDQVAAARRPAALVRLRKYAGLVQGTTPLTELAKARTREKASDSRLVGPLRAEVEKDLADVPTYKKGITELFAKYKIEGASEVLDRLDAQLDAYDAFVRAEILPRARTDFRLPPELYAIRLESRGIDLPPARLAADARRAFERTWKEMQALAPEVVQSKGLTVTDPSSPLAVLRALKAHQVQGEAILPLYEGRIRDVEAILRREHLVRVPDRPMRFRIATAAETARDPAPHVDLMGIFGHDAELAFVLPLRVSDASDKNDSSTQYDDFTFEAASWTLTAHEGRPGHDLQLTAMSERGISIARKLFAFNSVNVEGWALYAEHIMRPYMPVDGRFVSLDSLLLREARAFLDTGLQDGSVTLEEARRVLHDEVGASSAMTKQEIDRYTFRGPGQAGSYFYGYTRLLALRDEAERALGRSFDAARFHEAYLSQGLLPPDLIAKAVRKELGIAPR
jgi:hypothetical protein